MQKSTRPPLPGQKRTLAMSRRLAVVLGTCLLALGVFSGAGIGYRIGQQHNGLGAPARHMSQAAAAYHVCEVFAHDLPQLNAAVRMLNRYRASTWNDKRLLNAVQQQHRAISMLLQELEEAVFAGPVPDPVKSAAENYAVALRAMDLSFYYQHATKAQLNGVNTLYNIVHAAMFSACGLDDQ